MGSVRDTLPASLSACHYATNLRYKRQELFECLQSSIPDVKCPLLQVEVPEKLKDDLATEMKAAGIPVPDSEERWSMALHALKVHSSTLKSSTLPTCGTVQECSFCLQGALSRAALAALMPCRA